MKIGIDISQLTFENTGVSNYLKRLIEQLLKVDKKNHYILFYSSMRRNFQFSIFNFQSKPKKLKIKTYKIPPLVLDLLWNRLHIAPIEWFIGDIDVFISSDWTQPPTKARKVTILYDLIVYMFPNETDKKIIETQKRRLSWVLREVDKILCISEATKRDALRILGVGENKLEVAYPGI